MLSQKKTETGLESLIYDPDESDGSDCGSIHSGDEIGFNDLPDDFLDRLIPSNLDDFDVDDIYIEELELDDYTNYDTAEPDVKSEPVFFISQEASEFRCGVSTRARYLEDINHAVTQPPTHQGRQKEKKRKKGRSKSKKSKSRGRSKITDSSYTRMSDRPMKKSRRESKTPVGTLSQSRYTPDSLPLEIRNALREKIKNAVQDLAKSVSGPFGEKAVRLQAQGYRVAGRILVRPSAKDGKNKFTVCGKLAEAAGMTEGEMDKNRAIEPVSLTIPNVVPKEEKKRSKKHKKDNTESNAAPPTPPTPTTPQPTIKHEEKAQIDKVQKGSKIDNQMKCAPKPIPIDFKIKSGENNRISFTVQSSSANDIRIAPQPIKMEKLSLQNTTSSSNINPIVVAPLERKIVIQPIQTAPNIQIIQPLQNRAVFQSVNIMTAQQLTVLPIQTVQPVRNQTISTNDLGGCSTSSIPVSKVSTTHSSTGSHSSSHSSHSVSSSPSPRTKTETTTPPSSVPSTLSLTRTPSPSKTLSLKSRLTTSPCATPVVNPIKLIRKDQDKSPKNEKKVLTLKVIPLEEKEAILRGGKPLRTPTPKALVKPSFSSSPSDRGASKSAAKDGEGEAKTVKDDEKSKSGSESASNSTKSEAEQNPKIKIEPRTQSISLYTKSSSQSAVRKTTEKSSLTTTRGTIRTAPRKTPTPPNTPGTTPPRPTKSNFSDTKVSSYGKSRSTQSWTTKIVDNNSTILRSLPQGCQLLPIFQMAPVLQPTYNNNLFSIVQNSDSSNYSIINNKPAATTVTAPTVVSTSVDQKPPILHIKPKTPIIKEVTVQKMEVRNDGGNDAKITLKIGTWKCGADFKGLDDDRLISIKNTVLPHADHDTEVSDLPIVKTDVKRNDDECVTIKQDVNDVETPPTLAKRNDKFLNEFGIKMELKKEDSLHSTIEQLNSQNFRSRASSIGIIMSPVIGRKRKRYDTFSERHLEEIISNKEPVSEHDLKKIKSDIESAFSDYGITAKLEGNDPLSFNPNSSFEELLKNTQMDIPDWSLISGGDIALFDQSIELPEGTYPTDMFVLRIPTTPDVGCRNDVNGDPPLFDVKSETNDSMAYIVEKDAEIISHEIEEMNVEPLSGSCKTEPRDIYEEIDRESKEERKRVRMESSSSSSRWPKLAISAEDEEIWAKALEEAGTSIWGSISGKSQSISYSPMSPDFSEKGESPEHGMNYDDAEQLKSHNKQLVTPPDTPPQSLYGEQIDDEIEYCARQAMLSQIETGPDTDSIVPTVKRPSRVAIESFDIPFSFKRKRRHHSRDNCIKRGVQLTIATTCTSCQLYCEVNKIANACTGRFDIRSIQKLDSSKFLVILNREDDRNKFIKAIKKEKRKGGWRATTVDNSIYQEHWRKFSNEN